MIMATRKIHNRWHVDIRFDGKRIRKAAPENTKRSAKEYEQTLLEELEKAKRANLNAPEVVYNSYMDFAVDWMETYVKANNRPAEIKKKESIFRVHILPYFGSMKIEHITERDIEGFKRMKVNEKKSPKTINNMLSVLRKSLDCAVGWGLIKYVPRCKSLRSPKKEVSTLSRETEHLLLEDTSEPFWNTMIIVALKTGMRIGELLALRWIDIDMRNNTISVNASMNVNYERAATKNGRVRRIPMSYLAKARLVELYESTHPTKKDAYVFDRGDGEPHSKYAAIGALERILKRLGVTEHVHWHKFRHTCATNMAHAIPNLRIVQEILGHSSIIMTEKYSHVDMQSMQSAIHAMDYKTENFGQKVGRFGQISRSPMTQKAKHSY